MSLWSVLYNIISEYRHDPGIVGSVAGILFETKNRSEEEVTANFEEPQSDRARRRPKGTQTSILVARD